MGICKHFLLSVVVLPPKIEAQPKDMVDVVTGKAAMFTVGISWEQTLRSGMSNGNVGSGSEKKGRTFSGREDLQLTWEVLRENQTVENGRSGEWCVCVCVRVCVCVCMHPLPVCVRD